MLRATLTVRLDSPDSVRILAGALGPEAETDLPRSRVALDRAGDALILHVEADDVPSLRAAVNSHLRWCATALEVAGAASPHSPTG